MISALGETKIDTGNFERDKSTFDPDRMFKELNCEGAGTSLPSNWKD